MTSQSRRDLPGGDNFVDRLGDRLSADGGQGPRPPRKPEPLGNPGHARVPPAPAFPPPPPPPPLAHHGFQEDVRTDLDDSDYLDAPEAPEAPGDPFAEFEDEMQGESTKIDTEHLLAEEATTILHSAPDRPYLEVERGKDLGKQFFLAPGETGIGRSIDNDVILTDIAVSRRHVKVQLDDSGVLRLIDLGSGNGTQVNGRRVKEVPLSEGDRIELGETTLVVRIPGAPAVAGAPMAPLAPPRDHSTTDEDYAPSIPPGAQTVGLLANANAGYPAPSATPIATEYIPSPRRPGTGPFGVPKPWFYAFVAVGGIIVALLGATITAIALRSGGSEDVVSSSGPFNAGVAAYEAGRFDDAETAFQQVIAQNPTDQAAIQYLARVSDAKTHRAKIDSARVALTNNDPEAALRELGGVSRTSPLAAEAADVRRAAMTAQVAALRRQAEAAIERGDLDEARARLADIRSIQSDSNGEDARTAVAALEGALDAASDDHRGRRHGPRGAQNDGTDARQAVAEPRPTRTTRATRTSSMTSSMTASASSSSSSRSAAGGAGYRSLETRVLSLYRAGSFDNAASTARSGAESLPDADRQRMLSLAQRIETFGRDFPRANSSSATARQLQGAISLDERISNGYYAARLKPRLIDAYLTAARTAMGRNDMRAGCGSVRQALAVDPGNGAARRMSTQCEQRAAQLVREARGLETSNPDRARQLYNEVILMVPRGNPSYETAYQRKNSLARPRNRDEDE